MFFPTLKIHDFSLEFVRALAAAAAGRAADEAAEAVHTHTRRRRLMAAAVAERIHGADVCRFEWSHGLCAAFDRCRRRQGCQDHYGARRSLRC